MLYFTRNVTYPVTNPWKLGLYINFLVLYSFSIFPPYPPGAVIATVKKRNGSSLKICWSHKSPYLATTGFYIYFRKLTDAMTLGCSICFTVLKLNLTKVFLRATEIDFCLYFKGQIKKEDFCKACTKKKVNYYFHFPGSVISNLAYFLLNK